MRWLHLCLLLALWLGGSPAAAQEPTGPYTMVLGVAQDAGHPQIGCLKDCCAQAWKDEARRHRVASLAIIDPKTGGRWIIDATPDLPDQLAELDQAQPSPVKPVDGLFLTHAHMGHYTGLMHLGREAMGSRSVPVWAMDRMTAFLKDNGPWSQLVALSNIKLKPLRDDHEVQLMAGLSITPFVVPHRDEFSETVGFVIKGPGASVAWLPDIDKWERWDTPIEELIQSVDVAYLDGTFFANGEIPRDMSEIPHPFIVESLERLGRLPAEERSKIRFVHFNHTNPVLQPGSSQAARVRSAGFGIAERGQRTPLGLPSGR